MSEYEYDGPRTQVSLERRFDAEARQVFDAWTDPEVAETWLFSTGEGSECVLDPRPGGSYRITRTDGEQIYVAVGEYKRVDPPRRLVFTFAMPQFAADVGTVEVDISAAGGNKATLRLKLSGVRPGYEQPTKEGWNGMLDLLERALGSQAD